MKCVFTEQFQQGNDANLMARLFGAQDTVKMFKPHNRAALGSL